MLHLIFNAKRRGQPFVTFQLISFFKILRSVGGIEQNNFGCLSPGYPDHFATALTITPQMSTVFVG